MHVELHHNNSELEVLARQRTVSRRATRIRAEWLALMGHTAEQIGAALGYSRRTIQNWIYAYNRQGLDGLHDAAGRGQKSRLSQDQRQWLRAPR